MLAVLVTAGRADFFSHTESSVGLGKLPGALSIWVGSVPLFCFVTEVIMLILTRKLNEDIVINNETTVRILGIRAGRVRLGIEAPPDQPVHRAEVQAIVQAEDDAPTTEAA